METYNNIDTSSLVDYAYGMLSPTKAAIIEQALKKDEILRSRYEGIVKLIKNYPDEDPEALLEKMAENVQNSVKDLIGTHAAPPKKVFFINWKKLTVAASLLALIVAAIYLFNPKNKSAAYLAQQIIEQKYATEEEKGIDKYGPQPWKEAFKKQEFAQVINYLGARDSLTHEEKFFLGLAYLKADPTQLVKAEGALQNAAVSGILFKSDAWLYLGIAQLLDNKKEEAAKSLEQSQHPDAQALLKRLRQ